MAKGARNPMAAKRKLLEMRKGAPGKQRVSDQTVGRIQTMMFLKKLYGVV